MKDKQGEVASYVAPTYILNSKTPFLLGKKQMKDWKALINIGDDELVLETNGNKRTFSMTEGNHPMVELQVKSEEEEVVYYMENSNDNVTSYKGIRKVHEVHGHKSVDNLMHAYKTADLLTP